MDAHRELNAAECCCSCARSSRRVGQSSFAADVGKLKAPLSHCPLPKQKQCKVCRINDADEQLQRVSSELASHSTVAIKVTCIFVLPRAWSTLDLNTQSTVQLTRSAGDKS